MWTVAQLGADLAAGRTSSRDLGEQAHARIAEKSGEGARAFLQVNAESARADAEHADALRRRGVRRSPVDGLPVSLKDLFDVAGDVTRAGSKVHPQKADSDAAATIDAAIAVARPLGIGGALVSQTRSVPVSHLLDAYRLDRGGAQRQGTGIRGLGARHRVQRVARPRYAAQWRLA